MFSRQYQCNINKMRHCVYCEQDDATCPDVSFYQFPEEEAMLTVWLRNMSFDRKWRLSSNHLLCSKHFSSDCFVGKHLKNGSIPTIFDNIDITKNKTVMTVIYEGLKIKDEEVDIDDEFKINEGREIIKVKTEEIDENEEDFKINIKIESVNEEPNNADDEEDVKLKLEHNTNDAQSYDNTVTASETERNDDKHPVIPNQKVIFKKNQNLSNGKDGDEKVFKVTKSKKYIFNCEYCNKLLQGKKALKKHINGQHARNRHINTKHAETRSLNCLHCSYVANNKCRLQQHNYTHTSTAYLTCSYCSYRTYRKNDLENHINCKHTKTTAFKCPSCSYKTFHHRSFNEHINAKHTKTISFICAYCNYTTYTRKNFIYHLNSKHTDTMNSSTSTYQTCAKRNLNKQLILNCSHCSYVTYNKARLQQHINCKHTKSTAFECHLCVFKTLHQRCLAEHINSKHTRTISFICADCSYKTYRRPNLIHHIKSKHS